MSAVDDNFQAIKTYCGYTHASPDETQGGHAHRVFAMRYFPDQRHVFVTGGWDNSIKVQQFSFM